MNKEEAFRHWINSTQGKGLTYQEMWNASCEWQKEVDAEICDAYSTIECTQFALLIRNQP